jgi:predicted nucleotidyltransferase
MPPKAEILTKIREHSQELKAYQVKKVGIFGSFARSSQNARIDIDILVEFDRGGKTFDNYMDCKFYLVRLFHRKVDLVIKDALKARLKDKVLSQVKYA